MTDTVKWGIVGCGDVCEHKSGPAFYKIEHSELVAVMRRDEQKLIDFAKRHQVKKYYTDASELIKDNEINALYIATPPASHKQYAIEALQAGKSVYIEKPMAVDYPSCVEILNAAQRSGQKVFTAYYRRALPYFLKVKELLDTEAVGKILTFNIQLFQERSEKDLMPDQNWRIDKTIGGGGYFYDLAPHTLDILTFLLGELEDAKGFFSNQGGLYDVEDTVNAVLHFKQGIEGSGQWCFVTNEGSRRDIVEIIGTKGSVRFSTFSFEPICLMKNGETSYFTFKRPEHIQQALIQTIVDELRGIGKCLSTGISGAHTSWIVDKIFGKL